MSAHLLSSEEIVLTQTETPSEIRTNLETQTTTATISCSAVNDELSIESNNMTCSLFESSKSVFALSTSNDNRKEDGQFEETNHSDKSDLSDKLAINLNSINETVAKCFNYESDLNPVANTESTLDSTPDSTHLFRSNLTLQLRNVNCANSTTSSNHSSIQSDADIFVIHTPSTNSATSTCSSTSNSTTSINNSTNHLSTNKHHAMTTTTTPTNKHSTYSSSSCSSSSHTSSSSSGSNGTNETHIKSTPHFPLSSKLQIYSNNQTLKHSSSIDSPTSPTFNPTTSTTTSTHSSTLTFSNQIAKQAVIPNSSGLSKLQPNSSAKHATTSASAMSCAISTSATTTTTTNATTAAASAATDGGHKNQTKNPSQSEHSQNHHNSHHQQAQIFNIENELIKYTKNLKLSTQTYLCSYKLGSHIRNGGFSEIYEGFKCKTNEQVIIKQIPKHKTKNWLMVHNKKYPAEILLHKMSNNIAGVVKMIEFFEQEHEWIIIMPKLINCMDLFDYLESKQRGRLSEQEACHFFRQLIRINIDLLNIGVVHRDLKSENLLVDLDTMQLVLIDFGASAIYRNNHSNHTNAYYTDFHGTRQYKPPEYIKHKKYTAQPSTIWTLGILLYDMCNGQLPFETEQEILDYNLQLKNNLSDEYKHILFDCLKQDPNMRPTLQQLLSYPWFAKFGNIASVAESVSQAKQEDNSTQEEVAIKQKPEASAVASSKADKSELVRSGSLNLSHSHHNTKSGSNNHHHSNQANSSHLNFHHYSIPKSPSSTSCHMDTANTSKNTTTQFLNSSKIFKT
jgi:serine/threonine protein kinase